MPARLEHAGLTAKQERFAAHMARGFLDPESPQTQADAYRAAMPHSKAKNESIWCEASKLASLPKVRQRINELIALAKNEAEAEFNLTDIRKDLQDLQTKAEQNQAYGPAIRAAELRGKTIRAFVDVIEHDEQTMDMDSIIRLILADYTVCTRLIDAMLGHDTLKSLILQKTAINHD